MREIEVKVRVKDLQAAEHELLKRGCTLSAPIRQEDTIYTKKGSSVYHTSKEGHTVMRIRKMKDKVEFNLKQQRSNELDNTEYETAVDDPAAIHNILGILGYEPEVEVKKTRRKGKLKEYEICLDEVDGLGSFIELEKLAPDNSDPVVIQEELLTELESLGLSRKDQEFRGYDTQIYQRTHS